MGASFTEDMRMGAIRFLTALLLALAAGLTTSAAAVITDPPGNRHATQPAVPRGSFLRTWETRSSFGRKYDKIRDLIARDATLRAKIRKIAATYRIDPMHIVGALVGEHTYNVDVYDQLQSYYIKAISYADHRFRFEYRGEWVSDFIQRPEFSVCSGLHGSWSVWGCRDDVWERRFRGHVVGGEAFPDKRFSAVFFQPFFAGQTFGLGQINPLTALKLTDTVHRFSGYERLTDRRAADVYDAIMDPDKSLAYVAAAIRKSIDAYRSIAGIDISGNPGITATLYNVGSPDRRAAALAAVNRQRAARGEPPLMPQENYYGWLVNDRIADLRAAFGSG